MATKTKLTVGQRLYSLSRQKMGNTSQRRTVCHDVLITEIPEGERFVIASWNGNPPRRYYEKDITKLRIKDPRLKDKN